MAEVSFQYFNRDLSWLSFNKRVLMEAADPKVPLYERIKFLAIYSSNLDEFFRVRVAGLRSIVDIDKKKINKKFEREPREILDDILKEVNLQLTEFGRIKREIIIPELKSNNIILYREEAVRVEHKKFIEHYFKSKILSYLQPVIITGENTKAPYLENYALYFVIDLISVETNQRHFAHLNIPTSQLPRFIDLPKAGEYYYYIAIDDIMRENLNFLFPGYEIKGCYSIKLTRDADINIEDEYSGNLVKKIRKQIEKRNLGAPSRFLYDRSMPAELLEYLVNAFELKKDDLVPGGRYHNMNDLFSLDNPLKPMLENTTLPPARIKAFDDSISIFQILDEGDIMLHFPYQTYDYVLMFFNEAALDQFVTSIKVTFYRIASNSFISNALISAAKNGKDVTAFVEIKARFDEENNLRWASKMEEAGVKIIYSIPGLKVHAKVALVKRQLTNGPTESYGFFGTGNFNEKTAAIYADDALLTKHAEMTSELDNLFKYLENKEDIPPFQHLLVSQFNITDRLLEFIDYEIDQVKAGKKARIIIKLNNLEDQKMIDKLYEASQAGVKIDLIIRAINCLVPGVEGMSGNITVRRIVDRFLEHSRIYNFYHGGDELIYLGSSDWMKRNLYRRIEVVYPLYDGHLREEILKQLEIQLADNVKACLIDSQLKNVRISIGHKPVRAQEAYYKWLYNREPVNLVKEKRI